MVASKSAESLATSSKANKNGSEVAESLATIYQHLETGAEVVAEGWKFVGDRDGEQHYFRAFRSLCGRLTRVSTDDLDADDGSPLDDECAICRASLPMPDSGITKLSPRDSAEFGEREC